MVVSKKVRRKKCSGSPDYLSVAEFNIKFSKYSVNLCANCMQNLMNELNKITVPKGTKSKFNLKTTNNL